jgi:F0F1-type ATP synthase epsilon subunit
MFAELTEGEVYIKAAKEEVIPVKTGILKVKDDAVVILIEK